MKIHFHDEEKRAADLRQSVIGIAEWICDELRLPVLSLDIIIVDDETLRSMHESFLQDETYTDVMTFNLGNTDQIEGEVYISVERARENAQLFGVSLQNELYRLVIHAGLHLAGYDDKTDEARAVMKEREEILLRRATESDR